MTMQISVKDQYMAQFEAFINTLPDGAVEIKKSLDDEINKRVKEYKNDNTKTSPFGTGLVKIREKLVSKL